MQRLHDAPWTRRRVRALYRAIASIRSPFGGPETFQPQLRLEGRHHLNWLEGLLKIEDVIEQAPFRFTGTIEGGQLRYEYAFMPGSRVGPCPSPGPARNEMVVMSSDEEGRKQHRFVDPATIGTIQLEFYIFDRTPQVLKMTTTDAKGLKDFLDFNGGVRVYRNGIRVYDFGEPGNDWRSWRTTRQRSC